MRVVYVLKRIKPTIFKSPTHCQRVLAWHAIFWSLSVILINQALCISFHWNGIHILGLCSEPGFRMCSSRYKAARGSCLGETIRSSRREERSLVTQRLISLRWTGELREAQPPAACGRQDSECASRVHHGAKHIKMDSLPVLVHRERSRSSFISVKMHAVLSPAAHGQKI